MQIVDGQYDVGEEEHTVWKTQVVLWRVREILDLTNYVVGEVPDRASPEARQARNLGRDPRAQARIQIVERVVNIDDAPASVRRPPRDGAAV